jgi:hypothetical protein
MMRPLLVLSALLCPLLAACSLEPIINHQVVDYFEANDIASNQVILQNILRAKDRCTSANSRIYAGRCRAVPRRRRPFRSWDPIMQPPCHENSAPSA